MLAYKDYNSVGSRERYSGDFVELKVEGSDELATLCPVSKLTGFPMSMQQAITMIADKDSRLADVLFEVIPSIPTDDSISDDEKLKMLVSRLDSGSFFENDRVCEALGEVAKEFFPAADVDKVVEESKIDFSKTETPSVNE